MLWQFRAYGAPVYVCELVGHYLLCVLQPVPVQTALSSDGKMVVQFPPQSTVIQGGQSKSPVNLPTTMTFTTLGSQRSPAPQVIALPTKATTPTIITKPVTIVTRANDPKLGHQMPRILPQPEGQNVSAKPGEQGKLPPGQTQISFQVPVNWNAQGSGKSLLDVSKVSLVSFNPPVPNARSLLQTNPSDSSTTHSVGMETTTQPKVTYVTTTTAGQKTFITGNKVLGNLGQTCQVITQSPTGVISVSRPTTVTLTQPIAQRTINSKGGSFLFSNKQYTIVPNSSPHLVKTDPKNKGGAPLTAAQIVLSSGQTKISWPIQNPASTQESKQILITTGSGVKPGTNSQGKTVLSQKPVSSESQFKTGSNTSGGSLLPTAKVVELSSPGKAKSNILPAQKNWELVKQASQLLPQKQKPGNQSDPATDKNGNDNNNENKKETSGGGSGEKRLDNKIEQNAKTNESENGNVRNGNGKEQNPNDENMSKAKPKVSENGKDNDGADKMEVDDVDGAKQGTSEEKSNTNKDKADFDPVDAMKWKDGVGELPGSNLKVMMKLRLYLVLLLKYFCIVC